MVNRKMRATQALSLIRKLARRNDMSIEKLKKRGKGSHQMWQLLDSTGSEVARFGLTDHPGDLDPALHQRLEDQLAPWLGDKWTEKR